MSLINQVLNDLERRGAAAPMADDAVRVVPTVKPIPWRLIGAAALVLILLAFALAYVWHRQNLEPAEPMSATAMPPPAAVAQTPPAAAEHEAESAVAEATAETLPQAPASRLSFELSSIPLPLTARERVPQPKPAGETAARSAEAATEQAASPSAKPAQISKQVKQLTPSQQAELEFRRGNGLLEQGQADEAMAAYIAALDIDPTHERARQARVGLLLRNKDNQEAERLLQEGLLLNRRQSGFAMLLARLQVERNAIPQALETLEETLAYTEVQPDYHAFLAALLQRQGRHREAVTHYQLALQSQPDAALWLMGLGISLQALQHQAEARIAFQRAIASNGLSKELQAYVNQRLKELEPAAKK